MNKIIPSLFIFFVFILNNVQAQNNNHSNNDFMRSNDKIYVVMAVVITIVAGLLIYVFKLDKKIKKLEKEIE